MVLRCPELIKGKRSKLLKEKKDEQNKGDKGREELAKDKKGRKKGGPSIRRATEWAGRRQVRVKKKMN